MQLLAGTDAGTGGGVRVRVRAGFCSLAAQDGGGPGAGTHTGEHTGTYTQKLHLPFSDLPLKNARTNLLEPHFRGTRTTRQIVYFGAPTHGHILAKHSAEKTKYIDVSQPPHQGDELNTTLNGR